jgi:hypothetical protein
MLRTSLIGITLGLALGVAACGGGGGAQHDAAAQDDVGLQSDSAVVPDDAAPDAPVGFGSAKPITVDSTTYTSGTLPDPLQSRDYYTFNGTAGDRVFISTVAKGQQADPFNNAFLDLIVTLYDSTQTAIAHQDDPWPYTSNDPHLYAVLPSTGAYYITVEECNLANGPDSCSAAASITTKTYQIAVFTLANLAAPVPAVEGSTDQDGTTANAVAIPYTSARAMDGGVGGTLYQDDIIAGAFQAGTDVDVYAFKPPADYQHETGYRATATFFLQSTGVTNGDGSTARVRAWLVDALDTSGKRLAEVDQANYGDALSATNSPAAISVPITLDNQYYLFVENREGTTGAHDFYFIVRADDNYFGPAETADATNDALATAETMKGQHAADGSDWYGVNGDISIAGTDVDHYSVTVNAGLSLANVSCDAQRIGSGLRGFTFTLLKTDGTPISGGTMTEAVGTIPRLKDVSLPAGETTVILKVEATSQDPNVTATNYRCQVHIHA